MGKEKAIFKFNNGRGAILCSGCRTILKEGSQISEEEWESVKVKPNNIKLPPQYCEECENKTSRL